MPSAAESTDIVSRKPTAMRRVAKLAMIAVGGLVIVLACALLAINVLGSSQFASDRIRARAEAAITQLAGPDIRPRIGPARFVFDGFSLIALDFEQVSFATPDGVSLLSADQIKFGIRLLPLLSGRVELDTARMDGVRLIAGGGSGGGDWLAAVRDAGGAVDLRKVPTVAFLSLDRLVAGIRSSSARSLELSNVSIVSASGDVLATAEQAELADVGGAVTLEAKGTASGQQIGVSGRADLLEGRASRFVLAAQTAPDSNDSQAAAETGLSLSGSRQGEDAELKLALKSDGQAIDLGRKGVFRAAVDAGAVLSTSMQKLEIERLNLVTGRSRFAFSGAVMPSSTADAYKFELIGNDAVISPEDSTEPSVHASIKLAGTYAEGSQRLDVSDLAVRASSGEVRGKASFQMASGRTPGISVEVGLAGMSVEQVKPLWPWIVAGEARNWVMENFFGGTVREGTVRYDVAVGRLEDKAPLSASEVSGRFVIEDSRFDTAGALPPIRNAQGAIDFAGNDVDISLDSGVAFLSNGREISASNGTLAIHDIGVGPPIGKLVLDVAGSAEAIAELASLQPINAFDGLDFGANDFAGSVEGNVHADIPLERGIDRSQLGWQVDLTYNDLSLRKPLEGQAVSSAQGTASINPERLTVDAKARLDGIPAELQIVRPLGGSTVEAHQDVTLVLDDATRKAKMPGLNALLSGPMRLDVAGPEGERKIVADLTATRITIPGLEWTKGTGIPAKATFVLAGANDNQEIRDFRLSGKSFSATGSMSIAGGQLQSARFDRLRLNGQDDLNVQVTRKGRGYRIDVSGASYDARALIKAFNEPSGDANGSGGMVDVTARLGRVVGFGNEAIADAAISYSGNGAARADLSVTGRLPGGAVTITDASSGGQRHLQVSSADAGDLLRFLNVYGKVQGGRLELSMSGDKALRGRLDIRDFTVVNEAKLGSLVTTPPPGGDRSLDQAAGARIDTGKVKFDRGYADLDWSKGTLNIANGVLRGPVIGTTFQGQAYDANDQMDLTGTFMPAYGLNSMFGNIPVLGAFLGNGRDRGLIGITYRLRGDAKAPKLQVNPLSVIAPGIFRSIFEF